MLSCQGSERCSWCVSFHQESRAIARKPRDSAAVLFGLKFADNIHCKVYKFKNSQPSKAMLQSSKHTSTKQNLTHNRHSRSFKVTWYGCDFPRFSLLISYYFRLASPRLAPAECQHLVHGSLCLWGHRWRNYFPWWIVVRLYEGLQQPKAFSSTFRSSINLSYSLSSFRLFVCRKDGLILRTSINLAKSVFVFSCDNEGVFVFACRKEVFVT